MSKSTPYDLFKTDEKMEAEQGITLDYGDFKIQIARAGGSNKRYSKLLNKKLRPHRRRLETDTMEEETARKIMIETFASSIIIGWESKDEEGKFVVGIHDEDGAIIEYNKQNVFDTLVKLPDLFRDIQIQADKVSLFRAEELEQDLKK